MAQCWAVWQGAWRGGAVRHPAVYQKVYPPLDPPERKDVFFCVMATLAPLAAAIWAWLGATPGGGGGMVGRAAPSNLAPAS